MGEQVEQIPDDVYQKYFEHFDPTSTIQRWAAAAAGAGMKYFVVTLSTTTVLSLGHEADRLLRDEHAVRKDLIRRWPRPSGPRT